MVITDTDNANYKKFVFSLFLLKIKEIVGDSELFIYHFSLKEQYPRLRGSDCLCSLIILSILQLITLINADFQHISGINFVDHTH